MNRTSPRDSGYSLPQDMLTFYENYTQHALIWIRSTHPGQTRKATATADLLQTLG